MEVVESCPRKALVLTKQLPPEAAVVAAQQGGLTWTMDTELLATQAELMYATIRAVLMAGGAKKSKVPKPWHMPRPQATIRRRHQEAQPKRKATVRETMDIMRGWMDG